MQGHARKKQAPGNTVNKRDTRQMFEDNAATQELRNMSLKPRKKSCRRLVTSTYRGRWAAPLRAVSLAALAANSWKLGPPEVLD